MFRRFPLEPDRGLGAVLRKTRQAALRWADRIRADDRLRLVVEPSLDIVAFYAKTPDRRTTSISALTVRPGSKVPSVLSTVTTTG